jgi:hypothetical protein
MIFFVQKILKNTKIRTTIPFRHRIGYVPQKTKQLSYANKMCKKISTMGRYPRKSKDTVRLHTKTKIRDGQKTVGTNGLHRRQRTSYITALQRKKERKTERKKEKIVFVRLPLKIRQLYGVEGAGSCRKYFYILRELCMIMRRVGSSTH